MIFRVVAGGGGYPQGAHAGKPNRAGGRASPGNAATSAGETRSKPGPPGDVVAAQGRRPRPHNPQDTASHENPCRNPAPGRCRCQGVCDRRAQDGPVVARAADNGVDGRLGTALWCRLWGQEKKQVKTVGCSILPPPPHHPLTKNVTPAGTLPINCQWRTGGPGAGTGTKSPGAKRSVGRTTGYKVSSNWHASCLKGGTA